MRPIIQTENSSGADLFASEDVTIKARSTGVVGSGYVYDIPRPARVIGRSGLAFKEDIFAFNGLIDPDYDGEVKVKLLNFSDKDFKVKKGDRIAQLVILPDVETDLWFDTLDEVRSGGFGSTDK